MGVKKHIFDGLHIDWLLIPSSESPQPKVLWSGCPFSHWLLQQLLKTAAILVPKVLAQFRKREGSFSAVAPPASLINGSIQGIFSHY